MYGTIMVTPYAFTSEWFNSEFIAVLFYSCCSLFDEHHAELLWELPGSTRSSGARKLTLRQGAHIIRPKFNQVVAGFIRWGVVMMVMKLQVKQNWQAYHKKLWRKNFKVEVWAVCVTVSVHISISMSHSFDSELLSQHIRPLSAGRPSTLCGPDVY